MHKSEFPINTEIGTALIDKQLTEKLAKQEKEIDLSIENLYNSFRTEETYYKVEELEGDYITLINQDTGVSFSETNFSEELYNSVDYGTMLKFKNGKYVIDNNYLKDEVEKTIDEDELIEQTIKEVKCKQDEANTVEKDGKFIVDEELTEKSLEKIIELEKKHK